MKRFELALAVAVTLALVGTAAIAQEHEDINSANNPLTPKITINFHDYFIPSFIDLPEDKHANQFLLRGLIPSDAFGLPQLVRFTLPIATSPDGTDGYVTGVGDLTLIDLFVLPKVGDV
ncbi:MAG: hypothetical protein ACT6U0_12365, partial [Shinella sp.]